nr:MAG TPA: hypothetical protein [Bacteriophage sp.]
MFGYSFMNYNCLLRRLAKGARSRDFVRCYLSAGLFVVCPIDSGVPPYHGEPLVFLGYSRRSWQ